MNWSDEVKATIAEMANKGHSVPEIAKVVGKSSNTVYMFCYRNEIDFKTTKHKVSDATVAKIKEMISKSYSNAAISKKLGVTKDYVSQIKCGKIRTEVSVKNLSPQQNKALLNKVFC